MIMRTPGDGWFQILSLADIHTDGTAIDGILNAFMENKGNGFPRKSGSDTAVTASYCCGLANLPLTAGSKLASRCSLPITARKPLTRQSRILNCTIRITVWNGGNLT